MDRSLRLQILLEAVDKALAPMKRIGAGATGLSKRVQESANKLRELQKVQKDLASFRGLKAQSEATAKALEQQQLVTQQLGAKMRGLENPTRRQTREFDKARQAVTALKAKQVEEARALQDLRGRLTSAGIAAGDMAAGERRLRAEIARTSSEVERQVGRLQRLTAQRDRMARARAGSDAMRGKAGDLAGAGVGMVGAGAAIAVPLIGATRESMEFESTMTGIAQKANLGRREAAGLGAELIKISASVNRMPEDLQAGVDVLAGFGLDPKQATRMIGPIGKAATAYKADMADISAASFAAINNLKVPIDQTGKVLDVWAEAGKRGAFELRDMAQYMPSIAAAGQALGITGVKGAADLGAALQVVRGKTGDSAEAATNLQNVLQKIGSPATARAFAKMGIDLQKEMKKAAAAGKSPLEAIAEITNKATKGDLGRLGYLFEDAQAQAGVRALIQGMDEYKKIRAAAAAADGVVNRDFIERMKDQKEALGATQVAAHNASLAVGGALAPAVTKIANAVTPVLTAVTSWIQANPRLAGTIAVVAGAIAAVLVVLGGLALAASAILGPFAILNMAWAGAVPILGPLGKGLLIAGRGMLAFGMAAARAGIMLLFNPITWIVLAIVAAVALLAGAAYLIWKNWGKIVPWLAGVWTAIKSAAGAAISWLVNAFLNFTPLGLMIKAFATVWPFLSAIGGKMLSAGGELVMGLVRGIASKLGLVKDTIIGAGAAIVGWFKKTLGIKSPSRVFAGLGGYTMQGLAVGLRDKEREPLAQIRASARRMTRAMAVGGAITAAALPAAAAASAGGGLGPGASPASIVLQPGAIVINAAAGQSEEAIADLVVRKILELERAKARSARSSYDHEED